MQPETGPILIYDAACGFCARSVQFVLDREGSRTSLAFARRDGPIARALVQRRPDLASTDSVIWYEGGGAETGERVLVRSAAALAIARYLGGRWAVLGALGRLVPRRLADAAYDVVARHRHRIAGRTTCIRPSAELRERFLDPDDD